MGVASPPSFQSSMSRLDGSYLRKELFNRSTLVRVTHIGVASQLSLRPGMSRSIGVVFVRSYPAKVILARVIHIETMS